MVNTLFSFMFGILTALFPIANPIGAIPIFYSLTAKNTTKYRLRQARKITFNVFAVLAIFFLVGKFILSFFGISLAVVRIAGGLIVAHTAWQMVAPQPRLTNQEQLEAVDKEDISFTPMAMPIISGPGAIGIVIGFSTRCHQWPEYLGCVLGITLFSFITYFCLILGEPLIKGLGTTGIGALNRILGFLILAIAVQLIADGVITFIK
ncbi:MarC family protein [Thermosynechococcus sp. QKsg1]|uniref:MarC family protein n=1 Tax=unclassified Thermosynechococcus TaxID=2622553 RepID=UPI0025776D1D|nr:MULTISPECIES: MarC family protein [unclassified Thermosynechococcus]WJI23998.1 NAAT family transporter [Thermosynechococcus sp. B0]WJI26512.1 NAAT family transporter [Thermosynechococcus sp. B1]WJI29038.1 NAAT family transporter [Thermosynechococcus sp. B3]WNC86631.1 MarC family protein [Thermosynechococcus sp. QKsg1]